MTTMRPQKTTTPHTDRRAKCANEESVDVCELLVAELQARRVRLQELLALVRQEVERVPARRFSRRTHSRRTVPAVKQIA